MGLSTLLVAARFCRERQALLIVDPPASWSTPRVALDALRLWPFRSDSAVMYFPRVQAFDRLRGRVEVFGSCGAAAGMIARSDETWPVWSVRGDRGGDPAPGPAAGGAGVRGGASASVAGRRQHAGLGARRACAPA